ncbi:MAG: hypothetical protein JWO03_3874 [Bacteroidetes bacterium]|nr:hypothetical protein [Bacteroidota bacterium]
MKNFIVLSLIFLFLTACKKTDHQLLLDRADFPVAVGSWWAYQLTDQDGVVFDTVTFKIVDVINRNNQLYQRWIAIGGNDTLLVLPTDTSVNFYTYTIDFPVINNSTWTKNPEQGVSYTASTQNVTIGNKTYNNATFLNRYSPYSPGIYYNESIWIVKNIGIIKHTANNYNQPYYNEQLIDYHIN